METMTFKIKISEKYQFNFNHLSYVVKIAFFKKKNSPTLILATCYSSIQSYFKINLILTMFFNVYFLPGVPKKRNMFDILYLSD